MSEGCSPALFYIHDVIPFILIGRARTLITGNKRSQPSVGFIERLYPSKIA
jgi:hypothetical protein